MPIPAFSLHLTDDGQRSKRSPHVSQEKATLPVTDEGFTMPDTLAAPKHFIPQNRTFPPLLSADRWNAGVRLNEVPQTSQTVTIFSTAFGTFSLSV